MSFSLASALILSLVIIALAVVWVLWYKNRYTRKKSKPRDDNNSNHRIGRTMVYSTSFGLILGSVLADIAAIRLFYDNGEWNLGLFIVQIFAITFFSFIFGLMFGPIFDRIKRNLFVRNRDHSVASVFRNIGKIILCAGPLAVALILAFSGVSEGMAEIIMFAGFLITSGITGSYAKRRNSKIEKTLREGVKNNSNIEEVLYSDITDHDIMDCVSCDYLSRKKNLIIKHDLSDVNFSAVDYVTRVAKNNSSKDAAEVISYKTKKIANSPIICTFDKELTDAPMQLIETENPAFNKEFYTYCDNAEDAFYILTPQVMEHMIDVAKIYKRLIFNFDGDDLFIIVYQDKFMDTLAKQDSQTAFADLNKMIDDLLFKDIAKAGVHVQRSKNAPVEETPVMVKKPKKKHKVFKIVLIIVLISFALSFTIAGISMCTTIYGKPSSKATGSYINELTPQDYEPIQAYLSQKYGMSFSFDDKEYNSIWDSDISRSVDAHFVDANGVKFKANSDIYKMQSDKVEYNDSYQTVQFHNILEKQIAAINPHIKDVRISDTYYNEKFSSIEQYLAKGECQFITVYLKSDFGDINNDTALELSKDIINISKISNAFINVCASDPYSLKCSYRYKDGQFNLS